MAFFAEVKAKLGLDLKSFEQGVARAGGLFSNMVRGMKAHRGGQLLSGLGATGIVQGFRLTIQRAQEARDAAAKLNRTVDEGTASVARYGDAWDRIKTAVGDAAVTGLSWFTRAGEKIGEIINDDFMSTVRGMNSNEAERIRKISEEAGANADRLSSPEAIRKARERGDVNKREKEDGSEKATKDFADRFKDEKELQALKDKNARATMSAEQEIATLAERQQMLKFKESMGSASADELKEIETIEGEIVELKKKQREEAEKADKAAKDASDKSIRAAERLRDVTRDAAEAWMDLQRDKSDRTGFTLEEVARGEDGVSQTSKVRAKRILDLEKRAKRQRAQGFDSASEATMNEAAKLREGFGLLTSSERNPLRTQENAVIEGIRGIDDAKKTGGQIDIAAKQLRGAADELKSAATTVNSAFRSVPVP